MTLFYRDAEQTRYHAGNMRRFVLLLAVIVFAAIVPGAFAQAPTAPTAGRALRIQTRLIPPFVEKDGDKLTGFSIDLWEAVSREANLPSYTFTISPNVNDQLKQVEQGKADIAIAATSITSDRDSRFDFSQPFFNAGLQILVRDESKGGGDVSGDANGALSPGVIIHNLFSPAVGKLFGILMLLAVVVAHVVWLLERNHPEGLPETKRYFPGIFKTTWWAAATLGAQADQMPRTYTARIIAVLLMFTSALFIAYFTAAVTAQITVQQLTGAIRDPGDLPGKRVATAAGSTAESYLKQNGATVMPFDTIDKAVDALKNGQAEAVVFDAPVLLYYAAHEGKGHTRIVGPVFKKEDYGIVFRPNAPLRKTINVALLKIKENGTYDAIYSRWFGDSSESGGGDGK